MLLESFIKSMDTLINLLRRAVNIFKNTNLVSAYVLCPSLSLYLFLWWNIFCTCKWISRSFYNYKWKENLGTLMRNKNKIKWATNNKLGGKEKRLKYNLFKYG